MSNLHLLLDESNLHAPKGFTLVGNKTRPWKNELGQAKYTEDKILPKAINFVDGTLVAPTVADGDIYVLIGSGAVHASWGTSNFGDWTRALNTIYTPITPLDGDLCFDTTALSWMEYNTGVWAAFGAGGGTDTNLGTDNLTNTAASRTYNLNAFELSFIDGANTKLKVTPTGVSIGTSALPANTALLTKAAGSTSGFTGFRSESLSGLSFYEMLGDGSIKQESNSGGTVRTFKNTLTTGYSELAFRNQANGTIGLIDAFHSGYAADPFQAGKLGFTSTGGMFFRNASSNPFKWAFTTNSDGTTNMKLDTTGLYLGAGIGASVTGARLHVKGSGNAVSTLSLFAQNQNGQGFFKVFNDGTSRLQSGLSNGALHTHQCTNVSGYSSTVYKNDAGGNLGFIEAFNAGYSVPFDAGKIGVTSVGGMFFREAGSNPFKWAFGANSDATTNMKLDTTGLLLGSGIGAITASAKLHVKGSGNTSGTTAFLAENLSSTTSLAYKNDGSLTLSSNANLNSALVCSLSTGRGVHYLENDTGAFAAMYMYGSAHADLFLRNRAVYMGSSSSDGMTFIEQSDNDVKWAFGTTFSDANVIMKQSSTGVIIGDGCGATTITALLDIGASTTALPAIKMRNGVAPTAPNNGDIWFDGTDIKMRIGGVTKTFTLT